MRTATADATIVPARDGPVILRHTAATVLLGRGVNPKVVSEMLGHSNISITLGLYGHVTPHMQQYAADMMDRFLGG